MWKNLRNLVFGGIFSKVLLGFSTIFIINVLSKSDYAKVNNFLFVQSLVSGWLFSPFLLASVVMSNVHSLYNPKRLFVSLNIFQIYLVLFFIALTLIGGQDFSNHIFQKSEFYYSLLLGLVASVFLTFQNIILSQHQANESFSRYNFINILRPVFLIVCLFILYLFDFLNFMTTSLAFLISIVLSVVPEYDFIRQAFTFKAYLLKVSQLKWFWRSAKFLVVFLLIRGTIDNIALFLVSRYFSIEDFANFSVAFRYYAFFDLVLFSAHIAFLNSFTKSEEVESRRKFVHWIRITAGLALAGVVFLFFAKEMFVWINGTRYLESYPIFSSYMVGFAFYLCFSPVIYGLTQRKMFKTLLTLSVLGLCLQLVISYFGIQDHNLVLLSTGAVAARSFIYIFSTIIYFRVK